MTRAYSEINRIAKIISKYPDTNIMIEGHTDNRGSEDYNLRLSANRAKAVKQLLVSNNIPSDQMNAIGYGESRPKTGNDTPYGQQLNRRVEIFLKPAG